MQEILLREATERVSHLQKGQKLLVVTGDFHNFQDPDYREAGNYLNRLINAMKLDPQKDVFLVPGNHDVANDKVLQRVLCTMDTDWHLHHITAVKMLKDGEWECLKWRLNSFIPYCQFARSIGCYPENTEKRDTLPASVHIRCWRKKLNILHLNTALVADGITKDNQYADVNSATSNDLWKSTVQKNIPTIVLGHNSFYDLEEKQQNALKAMFAMRNVSAYLCGDTHVFGTDNAKQVIPIESGMKGDRKSIPNVICAKSVADMSDNYSDFGYYWHNWDEVTGEVTIETHIWDANLLDHTDTVISNSTYFMRNSSPRKAPGTSRKKVQDNIHSIPTVAKFFDRLAKSETDAGSSKTAYVSTYPFIHRIHIEFLPHEKDSNLLIAMLDLLKNDLKHNGSGHPIGFKNAKTSGRDFAIYYCLGLACKRLNKVDDGTPCCLRMLLTEYSDVFSTFPLHWELEGWYYRRKARRALDVPEKKHALRRAEQCDRMMMAELSIEENAGIYNAFASTVCEKLEFEDEHPGSILWDTTESRQKDWDEAVSYFPQIIEEYKRAWNAKDDYGKHHFVLGKLYLYAPNRQIVDADNRKRQIRKANDEFYNAFDCEESDDPDFRSRREEYDKYTQKCRDQYDQIDASGASTGMFKIRCKYAVCENHRSELCKPNEDFNLYDAEKGFFILADGVTRPHEEYQNPALYNLASSGARELCEAIRDSLIASHDSGAKPIDRMKAAIKAGNKRVHELNLENWIPKVINPSKSFPLCCTLLVALFSKDILYFFNCCDTVGYLIRSGIKMQFTERYNWRAELEQRMKVYDKEYVYNKLHNNPEEAAGFAIVNGDKSFEQFLQIGWIKVTRNDRIILSTDGLRDFLAATKGSVLHTLTPKEMIELSEPFDTMPFSTYADDKTCVVIDILRDR